MEKKKLIKDIGKIAANKNFEIYHGDCLPAMQLMKDNEFDLAIVDPPYGIGKNWKKDSRSRFFRDDGYDNSKRPDEKYWKELFRVSKFQIIWGANYFWDYLPPTSHIIWWDKMIDPKRQLRSAGELAWTNITKWPANKFVFSWNGCATSEPRYGLHPHEKPVALYKWLLRNYAKPGWKILDTHLGSNSIGVACYDLGFSLTAFELKKKYFLQAVKRIRDHIEQLRIFYE